MDEFYWIVDEPEQPADLNPEDNVNPDELYGEIRVKMEWYAGSLYGQLDMAAKAARTAFDHVLERSFGGFRVPQWWQKQITDEILDAFWREQFWDFVIEPDLSYERLYDPRLELVPAYYSHPYPPGFCRKMSRQILDTISASERVIVLGHLYNGLGIDELAEKTGYEPNEITSLLGQLQIRIGREVETLHEQENLNLYGLFPYTLFVSWLKTIRDTPGTLEDIKGNQEYGDAFAVNKVAYDHKVHQRTAIIVLLSALILGGSGHGIWQYESHRREEARQRALASLSLVLSDAVNSIGMVRVEYGSPVVLTRSLVWGYRGQLQVDGPQEITTDGLKNVAVRFTVGTTDQFGQRVSIGKSVTVRVVDTQAPVVELKENEPGTQRFTSYDVRSNITRVYDPVDGDLMYVNEPLEAKPADEKGNVFDQGWYTVYSDLDTSSTGDYAVHIMAYDRHGNCTETQFTVSVYQVSYPTESISQAERNENYAIIRDYLMNTMGLSRAGAAGVIANLYMESSFNPRSGSDYYGLCQWGGGRRANLLNWCSANGYDYTSVNGQLAFMYNELESYPALLADLRSAPDTTDGAYDAGVEFRTVYERGVLGNVGALAVGFFDY